MLRGTRGGRDGPSSMLLLLGCSVRGDEGEVGNAKAERGGLSSVVGVIARRARSVGLKGAGVTPSGVSGLIGELGLEWAGGEEVVVGREEEVDEVDVGASFN